MKKVNQNKLVLEVTKDEADRLEEGVLTVVLSAETADEMALIEVNRLISGRFVQTRILESFKKIKPGDELVFDIKTKAPTQSMSDFTVSLGQTKLSGYGSSLKYTTVGLALGNSVPSGDSVLFRYGGYVTRSTAYDEGPTENGYVEIDLEIYRVGLSLGLARRLNSLEISGFLDYALYGNTKIKQSNPIYGTVADDEFDTDYYGLGIGLKWYSQSFAIGLDYLVKGELKIDGADAEVDEIMLDLSFYY